MYWRSKFHLRMSVSCWNPRRLKLADEYRLETDKQLVTVQTDSYWQSSYSIIYMHRILVSLKALNKLQNFSRQPVDECISKIISTIMTN